MTHLTQWLSLSAQHSTHICSTCFNIYITLFAKIFYYMNIMVTFFILLRIRSFANLYKNTKNSLSLLFIKIE